MPIDPFFGGALGAAANIGGALITSGAQQAMNAENIRNQNMWNQQTLNAQMAQHRQNTDFMEDQQVFNREERQFAEQFNAHQAFLARDSNSMEAEKQRVWSTNMANTAYQRAMADMRAAGLNPILAYQQGGAQTPSGATASGPAASIAGASSGMASAGAVTPHYAARGEADLSVGRAVGNIANSAFDAMKTIAGIDSIRQVMDESKARTEKTKEETLTEPVRRTQMALETVRTSHDIENVKANLNYILAQTNATLAAAGLTQEQIDMMRRYGSREAPHTLERILRSLTTETPGGSNSTAPKIDPGTLERATRPFFPDPDKVKDWFRRNF